MGNKNTSEKNEPVNEPCKQSETDNDFVLITDDIRNLSSSTVIKNAELSIIPEETTINTIEEENGEEGEYNGEVNKEEVNEEDVNKEIEYEVNDEVSEEINYNDDVSNLKVDIPKALLQTNPHANDVYEWFTYFNEKIKDLYIEDLVDNNTTYNVDALYVDFVAWYKDKLNHYPSYVLFTHELGKHCKNEKIR